MMDAFPNQQFPDRHYPQRAIEEIHRSSSFTPPLLPRTPPYMWRDRLAASTWLAITRILVSNTLVRTFPFLPRREISR